FFASDADVLIADEFCATLDRLTARAVSHPVQKFIRASARTRRPRAVVVATPPEDLADDLLPSGQIYKSVGTGIDVRTRANFAAEDADATAAANHGARRCGGATSGGLKGEDRQTRRSSIDG